MVYAWLYYCVYRFVFLLTCIASHISPLLSSTTCLPAYLPLTQPGEWSKAIAKEDMLKIRRLMLEKLFHGWVTETRDLRMVRYKASMILSRMVRRTKGPLWVKEATLVCFHMWFRYIQVKVSTMLCCGQCTVPFDSSCIHFRTSCLSVHTVLYFK
jgi:hypothetical protein